MIDLRRCFEPLQILAIHDHERLIDTGECRFQTCGIVEVADDEFDLRPSFAAFARLRTMARMRGNVLSPSSTFLEDDHHILKLQSTDI